MALGNGPKGDSASAGPGGLEAGGQRLEVVGFVAASVVTWLLRRARRRPSPLRLLAAWGHGRCGQDALGCLIALEHLSRNGASCEPRRLRRRSAPPVARRYMCSRGRSPEKPRAPLTWMARSMTRLSTSAPKYLITAMSVLAALAPCGVDHPRGLQGEQSRGVHLGLALGDPGLDQVGVGEGPPADRPLQRPLAHDVEGALGLAQPAHAVMDPAWAEAHLRDLEAVSDTAEDVGCVDAAVVVAHSGVAEPETLVDRSSSARCGPRPDPRHPWAR